MMRRKRGMDLEAIIEGMEVPKTPAREKRHSPVYEALWDHHDLLGEHLNFPRQPDWPDVAARLAMKGITNSLGEPPTSEVVRKTWWKVNRDRERLAAGVKRTRRSPAVKKSADQTAPAATPARAPKAADTPSDDSGDDGFRFAGGPRKWKDPDK